MAIAQFGCDRQWRTPDTLFVDTVTILGRPNAELQMKDPANWVGTRGRRATQGATEATEVPQTEESLSPEGIPDGAVMQDQAMEETDATAQDEQYKESEEMAN